jgi:uncharacterized protein (TIGR03086 family)
MTTPMPNDLGPAARQMADLVRSTPDDLLGAPTPCPAYSVGDLLDHIGGLAKAFTWAATNESLDMPDQTASGDASRLEAGWRDRIAGHVLAMAEAWRDPAAWTGMTKAGPVEMPGEIGGLVALDEIVIHGWDLAVATGQPFAVDDASLEGAQSFLAMFSGPGTEEARGDGFGKERAAEPDAPLLERVLAMAGRDVRWQPT